MGITSKRAFPLNTPQEQPTADDALLPSRIESRRQAAIKSARPASNQPVTAEDFQRILDAVKTVHPDCVPRWQQLLRGLWHTSLNLERLRELSWEPDAEVRVSFETGTPAVVYWHGRTVTGVWRTEPMTPEFWQLIDRPAALRHGYVFSLPRRDGKQKTKDQIIKAVSAFGAAAGVVTVAATGSTATARDLLGGAARLSAAPAMRRAA